MKNVQTALFSSFLVVLFALSANAECPLGAKEDHLTLQRVMRNFGRFSVQADQIALRSLNAYEVITDANLSEAADKLGLAIECAQAVIDNPTGDMIPREAKSFPPEKQKEYMDDLVYFMNDFKDLLQEYRGLLKNLLETAPAERNFKLLQDKRKEVDAFVDHAHRKL